MSASATDSSPAAKTSRSPLRLVVFGLPGSGKSALLGALAVAAHKQQPLLNGQFTSLPEDLQQLSHRVYADNNRPKPKPTISAAVPQSQEVFNYPVVFQPQHAVEPTPAIISDCSGMAAHDLLRNNPGLDAQSAAGSLARTIRAADGLILLLDASVSNDQMERQFNVFGQFLRRLEEGRSLRTEVSGLPVFLVLTKCDELADPKDSMMDWLEQIEQRKREVGDAFRDFLAREGARTGKVPFGQIDLHLWATAISRPALNKTPARPHEPFGVAELFRQSLEKADAFRDSRAQAGRRLFWTASTAAGLIVLMGSLTAGLAVYNQETPRSALETRLDAYRSFDPPSAAERLRTSEGNLRKKLEELQEIHKDPDFAKLPEAERDYIDDRIKEIQDYFNYLSRIMQTPSPANLVSAATLREQRKKLETTLLPPEDWKETAAGTLHRYLLVEYDCLLSTIEELSKWFRENGRKAQALWTFEVEDLRGVAWNRRATGLLEETSKLPFAEEASLPRCPTLKPATALAFDEVVRDRDYFERMRERLVQVRHLLAALGMLGPVTEPPPLLAIPEPFALSEASDLLRRLRQAYPSFETEFTLDKAPDKLRGEVAENARTHYRTLLDPARQLVAQKQQKSGWDGVREWLKNPAELAAWRVLARVLEHLRERQDGAEALNPISALATFLDTTRFTVYPSSFILILPDDLRDRLPENGQLTIANVNREGDRQTLVYAWDKNPPRRDGENLLYTFVRKAGTEIVSKPGDELQACLPLLTGEVLRWVSPRSSQYQFARLLLPPRLHRNNQPDSESSMEKRIYLRMQGKEENVPPVPDLLPRSTFE